MSNGPFSAKKMFKGGIHVILIHNKVLVVYRLFELEYFSTAQINNSKFLKGSNTGPPEACCFPNLYMQLQFNEFDQISINSNDLHGKYLNI